MQMVWRCAAVLCFTSLVAGCSSTPRTGGSTLFSSTSTPVDLQCRLLPSSCQYDGPYEPGERDYAEKEARRLNAAELQRLRSAR